MNIKLFALAGVALGALASPVVAAPAGNAVAAPAPVSAFKVATRAGIKA